MPQMAPAFSTGTKNLLYYCTTDENFANLTGCTGKMPLELRSSLVFRHVMSWSCIFAFGFLTHFLELFRCVLHQRKLTWNTITQVWKMISVLQMGYLKVPC